MSLHGFLLFRVVLLSLGLLLLTCCASSQNLVPAEQMASHPLKDGIYEGEYWIYPFVSVAKIKVEEGKLQKIRVLQLPFCPMRKPDKEWMIQMLIREMVRDQTALVAPIAGAENPSYFMMQAVQRALNQAIQSEHSLVVPSETKS